MQFVGRVRRGMTAPRGSAPDTGGRRGFSLSPSTKRMLITALIIIGLAVFVSMTAAFWVQWWWFESIGYLPALTARYLSAGVSFVVAALLVGGFLAVNWQIALRRHESGSRGSRVAGSRGLRWPLWVITIGLALFAGWLAAQQWLIWRLAFAGEQFGVTDPLFGLDAGFYVFRLPALTLAHRGAIAVVVATIVLVALLYLVLRGLDRLDKLAASSQARRHLLGLVAVLLLLFAAGYLLANFELLYSSRGYVEGPGYTDVTIVRPLNFLLALVSVVAAGVLLFSRRSEQIRWLGLTAGVWVIAVAIGLFLPRVVQQTVVEPNQLQREGPYIANNIAMTRIGFGLDGVDGRNISGQGEPPASSLQADSPVLRNVRLWDYRIARETYQQLRSFVPYYRFNDVDVDRYPEDQSPQQVLVAARELDLAGLPANAQTWTNEHLTYTHGYGAVVSPIQEATRQGLPVFTVGGIPPESAGVMTIDRPELYFGENEGAWVAVKTSVQEVNGIPGDTPPAPYEGDAKGAISLDNYLRKIVLAIYLRDRQVIFTDQFTADSQVLLTRSISNRISTIAPYLMLDGDPYLTIVDGKLIWIVDAYTASSQFPYASMHGGVNYIRPTVKATVDAYDGTVTFYRTEVPDPMADAYSDLFGQIFRPIADAPPALARHFRYPEYLFDLQTEVFSAYHVTDPTAFYNGEDRWQIAQEDVEDRDTGETRTAAMEAYYMTLPLPGETETGFKLIRSFTPINRQNMTAWMAAQSDDRGTTRLVVYRFPRQTTVFGPQQVEARINQDPEISSQITLLSQAGSRVIRGNLLVIPVDETVMYVQPMYLQATGTAGAPTELKFVIIATTQEVEMRPTLEEALQAVADADSSSGGSSTAGSGAAVTGGAQPTIEDALAAFDRGQSALEQGDWAAYGEAQTELEQILESLTGNSGAAAGVPEVAGTPVP